jgi:hypothetical protein
MVTLRVKVDITEDREVTIKIPDDFPLGEAEVVIAVEPEKEITVEDEAPLTDEEINDLLRRKPGKTGAEIAASGLIGSWKHKGIEDSVAWVEEQRRKRRNS